MKSKTNDANIKKKKTSLGSKIVSGILAFFVIGLLAIEAIGFITARTNYGVSSIFGYQTMIVLTDSMAPTLPVGDGVIVKKVDLTTLKPSSSVEAHDGDIITFYRIEDGLIVTHRIIDIEDNSGALTFITLGDNLHAQTCPESGCTTSNSDRVEQKYVLGKVIDVSPTIGVVSKIFTSPWTTLVLVLIPLSAIFVSSVKDFIQAAKMKETEPAIVSTKEYSEKDPEFAKIKEQEKIKILKEMEKEKLRKEIEAEEMEKSKK